MEPLLQTKLTAPVSRDRLVARPSLYALLEEGLLLKGEFQRRLTLVSAPAGYGKTTLIANWLRSSGRLFAWLSLDEMDNDPSRFLAYLTATVAQTEVGSAGRQPLAAPELLPAEAALSILLNEIAKSPQPFILALDDYHTIHTSQIHKMVGFVLDHLPAKAHLAIITREDPLLPVARLRARGQALEIRQQALRFTSAETHEFLRQFMQSDVAEEDIALLEQRTEGWVAGLQLAALSIRSSADPHSFIQAFSGSSRYILDYLVSEVFEQQPGDVQEFLLKTAILERMNASLCDAITGQSGSGKMLEHLEQENLFLIPLDQAREWYRYHHLFCEFLRHRLRERGTAWLAALHLVASEWYEAQNLTPEAIEHALAAEDFVRAARLIDDVEGKLLQRGEIVTLLGWFRRLPERQVRSNARLCLGYAWPLILSSQLDQAESFMSTAALLAAEGSAEEGNLYALRAYLARERGDQAGVISASERALELLPQTERALRSTLSMNLGIAYWHMGRLDETERLMSELEHLAVQSGFFYGELTARFFLARTQATRGRLHLAESRYRQMIQEGRRTSIDALAHYDLGTLYREWSRLEEAERHIHQGIEISAQTVNKEFLCSGHILKGLLLLAHKDPVAALAEAEVAYKLARDFSATTSARCEALYLRAALALGDVEQAKRWGEQMSPATDAHPLYRYIDLAHPLLLVAQGRKEEAQALLTPASQAAREQGWGYALVAALVVQALAARTVEEALEFLNEALGMAEAEGFLCTFLDAGPQLTPLLQEAARRGIQPEQAGKILSKMGAAPARPLPGLVEQLTERELEVLRLVVAGFSNRQIARQLVISTGTAKTHVHNICGKLEARNRTEAAVRAKELDIV